MNRCNRWPHSEAISVDCYDEFLCCIFLQLLVYRHLTLYCCVQRLSYGELLSELDVKNLRELEVYDME